jgi:hypothetical protein
MLLFVIIRCRTIIPGKSQLKLASAIIGSVNFQKKFVLEGVDSSKSVGLGFRARPADVGFWVDFVRFRPGS